MTSVSCVPSYAPRIITIYEPQVITGEVRLRSLDGEFNRQLVIRTEQSNGTYMGAETLMDYKEATSTGVIPENYNIGNDGVVIPALQPQVAVVAGTNENVYVLRYSQLVTVAGPPDMYILDFVHANCSGNTLLVAMRYVEDLEYIYRETYYVRCVIWDSANDYQVFETATYKYDTSQVHPIRTIEVLPDGLSYVVVYFDHIEHYNYDGILLGQIAHNTGPKAAYACSYVNDVLTVFILEGNVLHCVRVTGDTTINVPNTMIAATPDGKNVLCYSTTGGEVIDVTTGEVATTISLRIDAVSMLNDYITIVSGRELITLIRQPYGMPHHNSSIPPDTGFVKAVSYPASGLRYVHGGNISYVALMPLQASSSLLGQSTTASKSGFSGVSKITSNKSVIKLLTPTYNPLDVEVVAHENGVTLNYVTPANQDIIPSYNSIKISGTITAGSEDYIECTYDIFNSEVDAKDVRGECYDGYVRTMADNWVRFYIVAPRLGPYIINSASYPCGNSYTSKCAALGIDVDKLGAYGQAKFLMGRLVTPLRTFSCKWLLHRNYDKLMEYIKASDVYGTMYEEYFVKNVELEKNFVY